MAKPSRERGVYQQDQGQAPRRARTTLGWPLPAAAVVLALTASGLSDRWELPFRDLLLSWAPKRPPRFTVAVVVDEASVARFGRFPWPRKRLAEVASAISAAGARGLVVDLLLAEPDPDDAFLATSLQRLPTVLAAVPEDHNRSWISPAPPLASAGTLGHATYDADHDGVVRTFSATKQAGNQVLPALFLAAAALLDPQPLPVGKNLRPDFLNRAQDIPQVPVVDVLSNAELKGSLSQKVVFLGATAAGLGDRVMTPTSRPGSPDPGVLVQAAITECVLQRGLLHRLPPWLAAALAALAFFVLEPVRRRGSLSLVAAVVVATLLPVLGGGAALFFLRSETPLLTWAFTLATLTGVSGLRWAHRMEAALEDVSGAVAGGEPDALRTPEARIARLLELAKAATRLEQEWKAQSRLLVHELKTPLAGLAGLGQLLAAYELSPEERQRVAELLATEATRLSQLVDTLLQLENLSLRPFPADAPTFDLAFLVSQRVELAAAGLDRPLILSAPGPVPVKGVAGLLAEAVDNLLSNAHKFSPPEAPIWVRVFATKNGQATVEVEDRGPGIPPEERDVIFKRFFRGKNAGENPGLGLGLSVVREVVTWHGGEVSVGEAKEGGSVFRITLPLASG